MKPCSSRISAGDQDLPDGCLSQAPSFCYHFNGTQQSGHSEPSKLQHFTTTRLPCDKRRLESLVSPAQSLTGRLMFLTHAVSRTCHAHTHHEKTTTYACDPTGWVSNTLLSPYGTCPLVCKVYFNAGGFSSEPYKATTWATRPHEHAHSLIDSLDSFSVKRSLLIK